SWRAGGWVRQRCRRWRASSRGCWWAAKRLPPCVMRWWPSAPGFKRCLLSTMPSDTRQRRACLMQQLPESANWNWARIRELAQQLAQTEGGQMLAESAVYILGADDVRDRVQAVFLIGFTSADH